MLHLFRDCSIFLQLSKYNQAIEFGFHSKWGQFLSGFIILNKFSFLATGQKSYQTRINSTAWKKGCSYNLALQPFIFSKVILPPSIKGFKLSSKVFFAGARLIVYHLKRKKISFYTSAGFNLLLNTETFTELKELTHFSADIAGSYSFHCAKMFINHLTGPRHCCLQH